MSQNPSFTRPRTAEPTDQSPEAKAIVSAVRTLVDGLNARDRERILRDITTLLRPISAPRAGDVLGAVLQLIPRHRDWTVAELKESIDANRVEASAKEIYNAIGYLARRGQVKRIAYGRYVVAGVEIPTSDDFGCETSRHEDSYRTDRGTE